MAVIQKDAGKNVLACLPFEQAKHVILLEALVEIQKEYRRLSSEKWVSAGTGSETEDCADIISNMICGKSLTKLVSEGKLYPVDAGKIWNTWYLNNENSTSIPFDVEAARKTLFDFNSKLELRPELFLLQEDGLDERQRAIYAAAVATSRWHLEKLTLEPFEG